MVNLADVPLWVFFGALFVALGGLLWAFSDRKRAEEELPIAGEKAEKEQ